MYVCICHGVTEKKIAELVKSGAQTADEIRRECGAGDDCGTCMMKLEKALDKNLQAMSERHAVKAPKN